MAKSLQEQLIQSGLSAEGRIRSNSSGKKRQLPKAKKKDRGQASPFAGKSGPSQAQINAQAKAERDRELNLKRQQALNHRETMGQIRQLIQSNSIKFKDGDIDYNFADGKIIRKIPLPKDIHSQVTNGRLAIAKIDDGYHFVPRVVADKIVERDGSFIIVANESDSVSDTDDEYADYKIPDDLMW